MRLACETLRAECGETRAPIGLKPILKQFDASVTFRPMAVAGKLELAGGGFKVFVNRSGSWRRHRFTIAHEIGHIIVLRAIAPERRMVRAVLKPTPDLWRDLERVCNIAAAEILMPREEFGALYEAHPFSVLGLRLLYDRFFTSFAALLVRIADTATDRTVVVWKRFARHDDEAIKLRVAACYAGLRAAWLPKGLTSGHFSPDVIETAERRGQEEVRVNVEFQLSNSLERFDAAVVPLKAVRQLSRDQFPMFNGHRIPDEPQLSSTLAMLLCGESRRSRRAQPLDFDNDPFTTSRAKGG